MSYYSSPWNYFFGVCVCVCVRAGGWVRVSLRAVWSVVGGATARLALGQEALGRAHQALHLHHCDAG